MTTRSFLQTMLLLLGCFLYCNTAAQPIHRESDTTDTEAIRKAIHHFIHSIDQLSEQGVAASYAPEANAFYPHRFAPKRLDGIAQINEVQASGFKQIRKNLPPDTDYNSFSIGLKAEDMAIKMLGTEHALVTWHSPRPNKVVGRRTAVLQKIDAKWLIVHMHGSNIEFD